MLNDLAIAVWFMDDGTINECDSRIATYALPQQDLELVCTYLVYSLNVEKLHKYVADGLVTCNSIFGFAGADNHSYEKIVERTQATELPLSLCYRCPKSHLDLVNRIYPEIKIESTKDAAPGTLECIEKSDLWNEEHPGRLIVGDMVLSRKTAPLVSLCIRLDLLHESGEH